MLAANHTNSSFSPEETRFGGLPPLPTGWHWMPFADLCERVSVGHVGPTTEYFCDRAAGIPLIRSQDVRPGRLNHETAACVTPAFHARLKKSRLCAGDILFVRVGANRGDCCVVPDGLGELNCANIVFARPKIISGFFAFFFRSPLGQSLLLSATTGAAQGVINTGSVANMPVPVPPLQVQRRIAGILSAYDELIENSQRRIRILEAMARALYREWFVHFRFPGREKIPYVASPLGDIPKGWEVVKLGDTFKTVLGGTPSRVKLEFWEGGTIPWINSGKVNDLRITAPSELITKLALERSAAKLMPKGTTVLAITGATLGQVSYLEIETAANQSVVGIVDPSGCYSEWIYLTVVDRIEGIINHASGGAQQHINKEVVNDVLVAPPPAPLAKDFKRLVGPIFREISTLLFKTQNLRRTRDLLLPRLVTG
jgi:type I restriction enzyme S subunit